MKKLTAFLLCICLLFSSVYAVEITEINTDDGETMAAFFELLMDYTAKHYRFDITYEQLLEAALMGMLKEHPDLFTEFAKNAYSALDENSHYFTNEEYRANKEPLEAQFVGLGVNLSSENGKVLISGLLPGSSAPEAGIQVGDAIVSVDGERTAGRTGDSVAGMIRGDEGTYVTLGLERGGKAFTVSAKRVLIKISPLEYRMLDKNNAGYVKISTFNANTGDYLTEALNDLAAQGADKILLDLRDNGGGYIAEAVSVASNFVPNGAPVVTESYRNEEKDVVHNAGQTERKFPVVVLVNEYSASASEIVAGAIKCHKAGALVGVDTYGKGTVQFPLLLKNKEAIWLTIAEYLLPVGSNIHGGQV